MEKSAECLYCQRNESSKNVSDWSGICWNHSGDCR